MFLEKINSILSSLMISISNLITVSISQTKLTLTKTVFKEHAKAITRDNSKMFTSSLARVSLDYSKSDAKSTHINFRALQSNSMTNLLFSFYTLLADFLAY